MRVLWSAFTVIPAAKKLNSDCWTVPKNVSFFMGQRRCKLMYLDDDKTHLKQLPPQFLIQLLQMSRLDRLSASND